MSNRKEIVELAKSRIKNRTETFFSTNPEQVNKVLTQTKQALKHTENIIVLDNRGIIIANSDPAVRKIDLHTRDYFQEASLGKKALDVMNRSKDEIISFMQSIASVSEQTAAMEEVASYQFEKESKGAVALVFSAIAPFVDLPS